MTSLLSRLVRRPKPALIPVTIYSREECCCCDKAKAVVESFSHKFGLSIQIVDIDPNPELVAKFGLSVPVVEIDGKVRFKGVVNPVLLKRLLNARRV
jgi:glutaredoxin